jgi:hypothetical protein
MGFLKGWLTSQWDNTQEVNQRHYDRHKRWEEIFDNGGGTASEFIKADFGTTNPNGLDVTLWDDEEISIITPFQDNNFLLKTKEKQLHEATSGAAWVNCGVSNSITLNTMINFGHEPYVSYIKEALDGSLDPKIQDFTKLNKQRDFDIRTPSYMSHEFSHTRENFVSNSGWLTHDSQVDFLHVGKQERSFLQRTWEKTIRPLIDRRSSKDDPAYRSSQYLAQNTELQARMNELIVKGYQEWDKLPATKMELWAALHNFGIKAPRSVQKALKSSEEGKKALKDFKLNANFKTLYSHTVKQINDVQDFAGYTDIKEAFWNHKYPLLYSNIIEGYGDKLGRERMGLGKNPRDAIEALRELRSIGQADIDESHAEAIAARVPTELSADFIKSIINLREHTITDYREEENTLKVCRHLLMREDVQKLVKSPSVRLDSTQSLRTPLCASIDSGDIEMTRLLAMAGANPFQDVRIYDMRGKLEYTTCPADTPFGIKYREDMLNDPKIGTSHLQQSFRDDPDYRQKYAEDTAKMKKAYIELMKYHPQPEVMTDRTRAKGYTQPRTLEKIVEYSGIDLETPLQSNDHSHPSGNGRPQYNGQHNTT